ncbi:hypothetical protein Tsubulata_013471 [Turnera subulata]|uniref:Wall-associated receptor kinase domain-containing protein n=1 Tax=Turnera subulata TaxID=218843 RepID=A0A9Q0IYU8_9ROSI|nr:hypothetical protein Tsubulata_013471 [Turnera subulata]
MTIPYPFGIGPKCYMSHWFDIECRRSSVALANNTTQFTAFIKSIKVEVVRFPDYSSYGAVTIRSPMLSTLSCPSRRREYSNGYRYHQINLVGSPFLFSTTNVFVAVGCNADASMSQETSEQVGCKSTCKNDTTSIYIWQQNTSCSTGRNCCQFRIQPYLQVYNPSLHSITVNGNDTQEDDGCKLAFLASEEWLLSMVSDPSEVRQMDYVPVTLEWMLDVRAEELDKIMRCESAIYS